MSHLEDRITRLYKRVAYLCERENAGDDVSFDLLVTLRQFEGAVNQIEMRDRVNALDLSLRAENI